MTTHQPEVGRAELDAARLLLDRMGITAANLLATPQPRPAVPTFAEYIPRVRDAVGDGTRRVYGSYWNRVLERWPDRRLDEVSPTDIKHLVDRIYEPEAMRFLDLEITGTEEIIPGVWCEAAGAHTEGSMNVIVETAEGLACICGDVIYDFNDQIVNHVNTNNWMEPRVTGNHSNSKREEKGAIKKLLTNYTFLLPVHDRPAKIEHQQVVGRLGMNVPGPVTETVANRDWFPM